jgi:predicted P-loop ATPase
MFWPSSASDADFMFEFMDAEWLDPDTILVRYENWQDTSSWPVSSRQKIAVQKSIAQKQVDPMTKQGIVGAFSRTYSISEAIEMFLSDRYEPCDDHGERYTYTGSTTSAGLVVYDDDKFAYSHHSSDPISGKLVNSFDLVRLHKFGHLDQDAEEGLSGDQLPSYGAMQALAMADDRVKYTWGSEIQERAKQDFATKDWLTQLDYTKQGATVASLSNLVLILRNDPALQGIAYNHHKEAIVVTEPMPWRKVNEWKGSNWGDEDDSGLRVYLEKVYKIWSPPKLNDALSAISHERAFHPIRQYLGNLPVWDGIPRLDELLINHLGADDSVYVRAVTRKTLVAAVARVMTPGCKFDTMLVLAGKQGLGKSTLFARLGGKWFNDSLSMNDAKDKTGPEKLQGYWILEIGELAGIRKAEVEAVKSFLSRQRDIYRPAYGRRTVEHPRQCIIVGSTNNDTGFLRDSTGNRRFWPVMVSEVPSDRGPWALSDDTVDQIWAEALTLWKEGENLYLEGEAEAAAQEQQKLAMESDERLGVIKEFLDRLLPENWEEMNLHERRSFLHHDFLGETPVGTVRRERVCISEIWCELFVRDLADLKRTNIDELHGFMRQIDGWGRYTGNKDGKLKFQWYGVQRAYERIE